MTTEPPFRAEQVGSLLRPPEIKEARTKRERGEIGQEDLKSIEDKSISRAVAKQASALLAQDRPGGHDRGGGRREEAASFQRFQPEPGRVLSDP